MVSTNPENILPVIYIQSNWDEVIQKLDGKVWVISKRKGCKNVEGNLRTVSLDSSGLPQLKSDDGFKAESVAKNILRVEHIASGSKISFLSATRIYSDMHKKAIRSLAITSTDLSISYCDEGNLIVWDHNRGVLKRKLEGHIGDVYKCRFFPSEKVVLSCGQDLSLKIWDINTGYCVSLKGHHQAVTDFAIIDVGRNIVSVSKDGRVKLWNCGDASCIDTLACVSSIINCCAITSVPDVRMLGLPDDSPVSEKEVGTKNKMVVFGCENGWLHGVAVHSRRKVFERDTGAPINTIAFLDTTEPTGHRCHFVTGHHNGQLTLYDVTDTAQPLRILHDSNNAILRLLPFGSKGFLASEADGSVYFITNDLKTKLYSLTGSNFDPIYDLASDGLFVYTACRDGLIRRYAMKRCLKDYDEEWS
ncbi:proteasomal ATPase-associated factor 1 [Nilaparvata lugens]|uniref:proteasomal ATPase-associated factor 1 n=1 Tax=Nilaparvata lugens TaxID=108931 RepID=UPI000B984F7E|nr:proteasomal ATPase-associated factor 1 [Nilaparvata lugens]